MKIKILSDINIKVLIMPLYLGFIITVLHTFMLKIDGGIAAFLYQLNFVVTFLVYSTILFLVITFKQLKFNNFEYKVAVVSVAFVLFSVLTLPISFLNENPNNYIRNDFMRSQIFFIALLSLIITMHGKDINSKIKFVDYFIKATFFIVFAGAVIKIILILGGEYYGGGLNQYRPYIHVLVIMLFVYTSVKFNKKKIVYVFLLAALILLAVLSLKRGNWVELFLMFFLLNIIIKRKLALNFFLIIMGLTVLFTLSYFNLTDLLISRIEYTFFSSDTRLFDDSTSARLVEIKGVLYTFSNLYDNLLLYLTGLGNGALYYFDPVYLLDHPVYGNIESSNHHVHSMYFIILIRHGIIGLLLYGLIPVLFILNFIWLYIKYGRTSLLHSKYGQIIIAIIIELVIAIIIGLKSNSLYGSFYFGVLLFTYIMAQDVFKSQSRNKCKLG